MAPVVMVIRPAVGRARCDLYEQQRKRQRPNREGLIHNALHLTTP